MDSEVWFGFDGIFRGPIIDSPEKTATFRCGGPVIKTRTMYCMIAFQVIGLLIVFYIPFGFDVANSYGLDFSDFMRLVYLIGLAFCIGAGLAIATKDYFWATIQGPPALVFVLFFIWVVFSSSH